MILSAIKWIIVSFTLCLLVYIGCIFWLFEIDRKPIPILHNGDFIFHTSLSNQSLAILIATSHAYTHMGIIKETPNGLVVVEASNVVKETPLKQWTDRGLINRFSVYRYKGLSDKQAHQIISQAETYYGKVYDLFFLFENTSYYCSELPYIVFQKIGLPLGRIQKIQTLHTNNWIVKKLIEKRWRKYPSCSSNNITFDECYDIILKQELITPASIAQDTNLERVYSNYPTY